MEEQRMETQRTEEQNTKEKKIEKSKGEAQNSAVKKGKRTITGSMLAKVIAFFILGISSMIGALGLAMSIKFWDYGVYQEGIGGLIHSEMISPVWNEVDYIKHLYSNSGVEELKRHLEATNLFVDIYEDDTLLWGNYDGREIPEAYSFVCYTDCFIPLTEEELEEYNKATEAGQEWFVLEPPTEEELHILEEYYPEVTDEEEKLQIIKGLRIREGSWQEDKAYKYVYGDGYDTYEEWEIDEYVETETTTLRPAELTIRVYVNTEFPINNDVFKSIYDEWYWTGQYADLFPIMAIAGLFFALCSFIFLMCSAGHRNGQEGIKGGVLSHFHFDIVTVVFGLVAFIGLIVTIEGFAAYNWPGLIVMSVCAMGEAIWCTIYCMELAVQLKTGMVFKHTLCWRILSAIGRFCKQIGKGLLTIHRGLPLIWKTLLWYGVFCMADFVCVFFLLGLWGVSDAPDILAIWFFEKVFLLVIVSGVALMCKKLQEGSEALADGDLNYQLDNSQLIGEFKKHGENLNRIKEGISHAVDERMKSEHLKTELITNVSHDLKTPLTSIINYADLLGSVVSNGTVLSGDSVVSNGTSGHVLRDTTVVEEAIESTDRMEDSNVENAEEQNPTIENGDMQIDRAQIAEYADVLLRQSKRLKKLLDDLMEASKATTGNLEVNLMPCEVSVILSQAVGEYEQRFAQKELELIVRQPEEAVRIQADGRHLWRVFDNLMNNICKYAQENTRVYLTVERTENQVQIVFRNMSKYPLELSAEELKERFTRGDKSRHMEGNGLGLSIAGSLVELQNGTMEIVTDGDLFKVILSFPILAE